MKSMKQQAGVMLECVMCANINAQKPEEWNEPIFESQNFVVIPSLGALVEGWLLLVPKRHFISMGAFHDEITAEMLHVKQSIIEVLETQYGSLCIFEHGPSQQNSKIGCG